MQTTAVRPWRLVFALSALLALAAYLTHPNLGEPLPQSLKSLVKPFAQSNTQF